MAETSFQGSLVALVTPMQSDSSVDLPAWRRLLDWHLAEGSHGLVVGGTTGESATLTAAEFGQLVSEAVARCESRIPVIAGTGSPSTERAVRRTQRAAGLGADAALVVTPSYNRPTQRGLLAHFRAVADASVIPVIVYNVPTRTGVDLLPETSLVLAEHENIVAIKEAVGDPARVAQLVDGGMTVLSGDDPTCCERMLDGARGVISVAANIVPRRIARLCERALAGDHDDARALDGQLRDLYRFLAVETNPIPAKWLLAQTGRIVDGLRLPLVSLDPRFHEQGRALISELSLDAIGDVA